LTLARLPGHGLVGDELLLNTTADEVIQYTKEIINIASQTCDSLIVFSCSTGSTLSAYLSSEDDRIVAQMMTSPNFGILDPKFDLLDGPWGLRLARLAVGSKYNIWEPPTEEVRDYWYTKYRIEGLVVCDQIVSNTMTDQVFAKINTPVYIGYNYTDEEHKDKVINVDLIQPFAQAISTPDSLVVTEAFTVCKHHVMTTENQELYMGRAITLARQAGKAVKSNPHVGCVVVSDGRVIGEGYHQVYGQAHAEVNALNSVKDQSLIAGSTLYVTLEPCNHTGKTPPCSQRIIDEGIGQVVIGCLDPTPLVDGKGLRHLQAHGVSTTVLDHTECKSLIRPFLTNQIEHRPYIIIKYAQSQDGYIGQLDQQVSISGQDTNILSHRWRGQIDGILIGNNTALIDNPSLTTRHYPGDNPLRIVIDYSHRIPPESKLITDGLPTLILNGDKTGTEGQVLSSDQVTTIYNTDNPVFGLS